MTKHGSEEETPHSFGDVCGQRAQLGSLSRVAHRRLSCQQLFLAECCKGGLQRVYIVLVRAPPSTTKVAPVM